MPPHALLRSGRSVGGDDLFINLTEVMSDQPRSAMQYYYSLSEPPWYSGTMRERSPSAWVRILSTVRVQIGLPHSEQGYRIGWALR
ncbi:hypothetical protein E2C01_097490 [Portunus trituberculatus]|uniref:Uncharacterized protein n=1 Tax=Portunus trituberculatus TaxID=210409 RepID=A0A5B7KA24_PORTR|nr:hypothetical protein [Portunus trituberculatus]